MDQRRAQYVHKAAKAKDICAPSFAFAVVLYPTLLSFLYVARMGTFSLLIPTAVIPSTPPSMEGELHGKYDLWETYEPGAVTRTAFGVVSVAILHVVIAFHLVMRGLGGSGYVKAKYSWIFPITFWFVTTTFYINYVSIARYHAHIGEWLTVAVSSVAILGFTIGFLLCECRVSDVMEEEEDPEVPVVPAVEGV